jgi:hypothetical protein
MCDSSYLLLSFIDAYFFEVGEYGKEVLNSCTIEDIIIDFDLIEDLLASLLFSQFYFLKEKLEEVIFGCSH